MTTPRTHTPDRVNDDGSTTITMKRACNGCGQLLGDVTDVEVDRAIAGLPPLLAWLAEHEQQPSLFGA